MNASLSPHRVWTIAAVLIATISVGYVLALFRSGEALGKAPMQCPGAAKCKGENCPMMGVEPNFHENR